MPPDQPIVDKEFIASFRGFLNQVNAQAPEEPEPVFLRLLREHFGTDPAKLPIVAQQFEKSEHPNLHIALTDYLAAEGRTSELRGMVIPNEHMGVKLAQ